MSAAVSARAVELSKGLYAVAVDLNVSAAVVLHDLVRARLGATANDVGSSAALLDRDGVLADILEPDVVDVARAKAVNALLLVLSNDNIPDKIPVKNANRILEKLVSLDSAARLYEEDGVGITTLAVRAGIRTAVEADVSAVEYTAD